MWLVAGVVLEGRDGLNDSMNSQTVGKTQGGFECGHGLRGLLAC